MQTQTLLDDLCFGEGPRWHDGKLYFSDMHDHKVWAVTLDGHKTLIAEVAQQPSGLGWLPDGSLLIVSMLNRQLLRWQEGKLEIFADLMNLASYHCNDMVTDRKGRSWVGNFGFDIFTGETPCNAELILVDDRGQARVVAEELAFPNGAVITPDGSTLIVGETWGARLTAFDIAPDGSLDNRRLWAQLENAVPDGICLDEALGIWVASPSSNEVLRVEQGGHITHRIPLENPAYACMLAGEDRRTLCIFTAESSVPEECRTRRSGRIETIEVEIPGARLP